MTLRVDIQIVPFGDENSKENIFRFDISNIETIKNLGFGHVICRYKVEMYKWNNKVMQDLLKVDEWFLEQEFEVPEHDRRDGAIELVRKVVEIYEKSN